MLNEEEGRRAAALHFSPVAGSAQSLLVGGTPHVSVLLRKKAQVVDDVDADVPDH